MASESRSVPLSLALCYAWLLPLALLGATSAYSQEKLEKPEDTNERIRQLATAFRPRQSDYVLGGGDLVRIEVFDVPELSREVRIGESGYVSLPLLPLKVHAGGLTAFQLEEKLAELLQVNGLVAHPQVTVFVKEQRSQPITIIGAVRKPFVYQAIRQTTLLEVLSEAGGIADDAGGVVLITRRVQPSSSSSENEPGDGSTPASGATGNASAPASQTITVGLKDLLESGDPRFNITLYGGDVVAVPRAGVVYVVGAVEKPGGFVLANDREQMTALKVVALAGGLKGTAKPHQAVILRKNGEAGQRQEVAVDVAKILERKNEDVSLLPDDILFVPDSTGKRALRRSGEVALALASGVVLLRLGR